LPTACRPRIVISEPGVWSDEGLAGLAELGDVVLGGDPSDADVLCLRVETRVDQHLLNHARRLKVVVSPTTGLDHLDVRALGERRIALLSLKGERDFLDGLSATAEHVFALLLALYRRIPAAHDAALRGDWLQSRFRGRCLAGKRLGIVGFGRVGTMVARFGRGFAMRVSAYEPTAVVPAEYTAYGSLVALAANSDVLSVNASFDETTRGLITAAVFDAMPPGAVLVNTARGAIVDEDAMVRALEKGRLAGAAVDVLDNEHDCHRGSRLLEFARTHTNVVITPHIGGQTVESVRDADLFIVAKLKRWLDLAKHGA
jgi:D-3-phosphoglycerate dehydrogenase